MNNIFWTNVKENDFNSIPAKCGVYLIVVECKDKKKYVVYSGQSSDLNCRIKDHWGSKENNFNLKNAIQKYKSYFSVYYAIVDENLVDNYERFLKDKFNPQFQNRAPDVDPKEMMLPNVVCGVVNFNPIN